MNEQVRINRSAIASLVLGLTFWLPLLPALLAVLLGIVAKRNIRRSQGRLLGEGLAMAGIILGVIQGLLWSFALFSGSLYVLNLTESAVITRFGKIQKTVKTPGLHVKLPLIDVANRYPYRWIFEWHGGVFECETADGQHVALRGRLRYRICEPERYMQIFGPPNEKAVAGRIDDVFRMKIIDEARKRPLSEFVSSVRDVSSQKILHGQISEILNKFGICIIYESLEPYVVFESEGHS